MTEKAVRVTVGENGRLVLPAPFRRALGLSGTGQVVLTLEGDAVRVSSVRQRLMDARTRFRRFVPAGQGMVDALIEERRSEAAEEDTAVGTGTEGPGAAKGDGGDDVPPTASPAPEDDPH